jgi:uncharacterized membrane-anchored protein YhcB (DUF1043 family)
MVPDINIGAIIIVILIVGTIIGGVIVFLIKNKTKRDHDT